MGSEEGVIYSLFIIFAFTLVPSYAHSQTQFDKTKGNAYDKSNKLIYGGLMP